MKKHYRQGDVLIIQATKVPKDAEPIAREAGRIVLAHGEVTGHSHAIGERHAKFLGVIAEGAQRRFIEAKKPVRVLHEEHGPIELPAGTFEVVIQREYEPGAIRNVVD